MIVTVCSSGNNDLEKAYTRLGKTKPSWVLLHSVQMRYKAKNAQSTCARERLGTCEVAGGYSTVCAHITP
jgi:hypothetical protein